MQIGIIGAGKVGTTLGKNLVEHDICVTGFYSRTFEHAQESAKFSGTEAFQTLEELCGSSDTLFLAVPDDTIRTLWDRIDKDMLRGKMICHFSGSLSSLVFSGRGQWDISAASAHPVFAFHDRFDCVSSFQDVPFTLEGDEKAVAVLKELVHQMGHKPFLMDSRNKEKYHAAASMVSNHAAALFDMGFSLLLECGFEETAAREIFMPLILGNARNVCEHGAVASLTGPIERGDIKTVEGHLLILDSDIRTAYVILAKRILEIAKKKHPEREYVGLEKILEAYIS